MSEKENMLAGLFYNSLDPELVRLRQEARRTLWQYNATDPADESKRRELMEKLFGQAGKNLIIEPPFYCDYGSQIHFGDNVFLGPNCAFYTPVHPLDAETRNKGLEYAYPIKIGNNVWFGGNVVVLPGVTIGDNVVIGAGSVVVKDIPPNVLAVGNPCKIVKNID